MHETQRRALLRELAATPAGAEFTCNSGSMEPTIHVGDKVRARARPLADYRIGDVVVYEGSEGFMLHRIALIAPSRAWFLHIGDAPSARGPGRATMHSIVGRVDLPRRLPRPRALLRAARHALRHHIYW